MTYASPAALRAALERQLRDRSTGSGVGLDRLRRRVVVERVMSRLQAAEPGAWVLKGGMALEVRLHDDARLTKDVDLGLRSAVDEAGHLRDRLVEALTDDPFGDGFVLVTGPVAPLVADRAGFVTWRSRVAAQLAGKAFGAVQLDISPRAHELDRTDALPLPNSLAFAGIEAPTIEVVDVHRHAAEKLHAMARRFDDRENSRVRDLVDLVLLTEHGLLDAGALAATTRRVWRERDGTEPPATFPAIPAGWVDRYERAAAELGLDAASFPAAVGVVTALWDGTAAPTAD